MSDLVKRLRASVRMGANDGNGVERLVCGKQMLEAADRIEQLERDNAALREVLTSGREIIERAGTAQLADGTYFDKDCACTLWLAKIDALAARLSGPSQEGSPTTPESQHGEGQEGR
jgi:hypothetical protein